MKRPDFSNSYDGTLKVSLDWNDNFYNGAVADASFASEETQGVSDRRKPKGWVPPTGYHFKRIEYQRALGECYTMVVPTNWSKYSGCVGGGGGRFNSLNHFDEILGEVTAFEPLNTSAALAKARNKIKAKKVDLGVAFGERKATTMMLADTTRRLADSVRSLRRGNFREAARRLGIVNDIKKPRGSNWTNHWLQLQYGWKPLLSDCYGAVDALSKRPPSDWRVTAKASSRDHDYWESERYPQGTDYPIGNYDACRLEARRNRGVFVRIDAIPENDLTMSLVSLGVTNPLMVAWELVPYSFVVDWFLPIGNWLDSLDAMLGYGSAWTSITTRNEAWWEDTGLSKSWSPTSFVSNNYTGTKRVLEVTRSASSGVPLPSFPSFKDARSLGHFANGLSLLAQAFGRVR